MLLQVRVEAGRVSRVSEIRRRETGTHQCAAFSVLSRRLVRVGAHAAHRGSGWGGCCGRMRAEGAVSIRLLVHNDRHSALTVSFSIVSHRPPGSALMRPPGVVDRVAGH